MNDKAKNKNIEKLLDRYYQGKTSLDEERILRYYFLNDTVASSLDSHKQEFVISESYSRMKDEISQAPNKANTDFRRVFRWVAAIFIPVLIGNIILVSYLNANKKSEISELKQEIVKSKYKLFTILINSESSIDRTKAIKLLDANEVNDEVFNTIVRNLKHEKSVNTKLATLEFLSTLDKSYDKKIQSIEKEVFQDNSILESMINKEERYDES